MTEGEKEGVCDCEDGPKFEFETNRTPDGDLRDKSSEVKYCTECGKRVHVNKFLELREDPSVTLFHYTSVSNLLNILESKSLWATDIRYMNDSRELRHGLEVLDKLLECRIPVLSGKQAQCAKEFRQWIARGHISGHRVFVTCLTEQGNQLSQWRGYCPPGKGVSLGFGPEELIEIVDEQGFKLAKVIYREDRQLTVMGYLIDGLMEAADSHEVRPPNALRPMEQYRDLFGDWHDTVTLYCAMMKHPKFSEEGEWRAISLPSFDLKDAPLQFRDGPLALTPFIQLKLPRNASDAVSLQKAFLGPTPNLDIAIHAADSLLCLKQATPRENLEPSGIPLRTVT